MTTGNRIRATRKLFGLTQKQLGEILGVSGAMIGQYENGQRNPKIETIKKIAGALGCHPSLLTGTHSADLIDEESFNESLRVGLVKVEDIANEMNLPYEVAWDSINHPEKVPADIVKKVERVGKLLMYEADTPEEKLRKDSLLDIHYLLSNLNIQGIETAVERIKELSEIPKYQRTKND